MKFNKKELFYYCNNELRYKKLNKIKVNNCFIIPINYTFIVNTD